MNKYIYIFLITCISNAVFAEESEVTTIDLKYINGSEVLSVLKSLTDKSVSISTSNNMLIIKGAEDKVKNITPIINKIDTPPTQLTIEFIASSRKINFGDSGDTLESSRHKNKISQSMSIIERQWVKLNTGLSIPVAQRKKYADGTESQSFSFKKISKSYIFKVHEFSGWSVVQVGLNASELSDDISGAIEHTQLDTTIVGKTGEWLEVASSKSINENGDSDTYSTNRTNRKLIHLYLKVKKPAVKPAEMTKPDITNSDDINTDVINTDVINTEKK